MAKKKRPKKAVRQRRPTPLVSAKRGHLWVSVSVWAERAREYYGTVDPRELNRMIDGKNGEGYLKLQNVFWQDQGEVVFLARLRGHPEYTDTAYLKVRNINRVVPLDSSIIDEAMAKLAERMLTQPNH